MAANFKIKVSRIGDDLHFNLAGDFDGSSAWELINDMAEKSGARTSRILIDTSGLKNIHPFGKAVFEKQMPLARRSNKKIIFLGKHADKIIDHSTQGIQEEMKH